MSEIFLVLYAFLWYVIGFVAGYFWLRLSYDAADIL
jgi:hypothetical protein